MHFSLGALRVNQNTAYLGHDIWPIRNHQLMISNWPCYMSEVGCIGSNPSQVISYWPSFMSEVSCIGSNPSQVISYWPSFMSEVSCIGSHPSQVISYWPSNRSEVVYRPWANTADLGPITGPTRNHLINGIFFKLTYNI